MIVIPAIDILDGVGVRLYQGKYEQKDVLKRWLYILRICKRLIYIWLI